MSWRFASVAVLVVVLGGGLAWYERSRPSSRIVALVAALAALAVAGRLVFAPIPNVQATTDIVLFTGFSLGGAPGFAVGALGALVSNLWLGQGPWTPWEMAAWGLVGLGGAALGALTHRRLGRLGLAVACGLAGLAYGALLDLSVMVTGGGAQSLDRYLAISARGVPFNVAHAAGNFALALAAGPTLVRMISRYRERLEFSWRPGLAGALLGLVLIPAAGPAASARAAPSGASWLAGAEGADGGFGVAPGSASSPAMTGWAALGLEGAGVNPLDVGSPGANAIAYLRARAGGLTSTGDLERTILALAGAGVNPRSLGGQDLIARLRARESGDGSFGEQVNLTAFGILALRAAGEPASTLRRPVSWLERAGAADGGWGFQDGSSSDPDSTGAAIQGLAAAGGSRAAIGHGVAYLRADQMADGGWPLGGNGPTNSQSTAWAIQGLIAAGTSPASVSSHGRSGLDYLASRQAGDGHYRYSAASDQTPVWVTGQALLAVDGRAFPLAAVPRRSSPRRRAGGGSRGGGGGSAPPGHSSPPQAPSSHAPAARPSPAGRSRHGKRSHSSRHSRRRDRHGKAAPRGSGSASGRRLFAGIPSASADPGSPGPAPSQGSGSHAARAVEIAAALALLAALGCVWLRRRRT